MSRSSWNASGPFNNDKYSHPPTLSLNNNNNNANYVSKCSHVWGRANKKVDIHFTGGNMLPTGIVIIIIIIIITIRVGSTGRHYNNVRCRLSYIAIMCLLHPTPASVIRPIRRRIIIIIVIIVVVPPGKTLSPVPTALTGSWPLPWQLCCVRMMLTVPMMVLFVCRLGEVNCGRGDSMFRTSSTAVHIKTR